MVKSSNETKVKEAIQDFVEKITKYRYSDNNKPTVSIGYSLYNKADGNIDQAIKKSDEQMYYYKEKKKFNAD